MGVGSMDIKIIGWEEGKISQWSGGTTNQLAISPENLTVKDDFLWRISTATVMEGRSKFSDFSGYNRFLTILKGEIEISHRDKSTITLKEKEPHFFSGAWETESSSQHPIADFNFIWKESLGDLEVKILKSSEEVSHTITFKNKMFIYSLGEDTQLFFKSSSLHLNKNSLILVQDEENICFSCLGDIIFGELV